MLVKELPSLVSFLITYLISRPYVYSKSYWLKVLISGKFMNNIPLHTDRI